MIFVILLIVVILFTVCVTIILDHKDSHTFLPIENYVDNMDSLFERRR